MTFVSFIIKLLKMFLNLQYLNLNLLVRKIYK